MALTHHDRRRITIAVALTLVALPALWFANRPDSGAPSVATAGIAVGSPDVDEADVVAADTDASPVFLDGPTAQVGAGVAEIAVPIAPDAERFTMDATFRSNLPAVSICRGPGLPNGATVTIVNLENNRSVTCTALLAPSGAGNELVLHPELFAQIADLTDAPIPVEIRR